MKGRCLELVSVIMLGLGHMFIMTGYDTQGFIVESVIHSVNSRYPEVIGEYAGYYGQGIVYISYMLSCLISPSVLLTIGPKRTLLFGSICFTVYQLGFLHLNAVYYYCSCAIMGFGFALYYTGNGGYLTSHSTRDTVEANTAVCWSIGCFCMLIGGGALAAAASTETTPQIQSNSTDLDFSVKHKIFTDTEIFYVFAIFSVISLLANIDFLLIPSKEIDNCIENTKGKKDQTFKQQMNLMFTTLTHPKMVLEIPHFFYLGVYTSFWVNVYPTTFNFTHQLAGNKYLPAIYSITLGSGEIIMGMFLTFMCKRIKNFGLKPAMYISFSLNLILLLLICGSTSPWATVRPTDEPAWLFTPSVPLTIVIGILMGLVDFCINNTRTVICALVLPQRRTQCYSISKFYQALGGAVVMFISPYLNIQMYTILLLLLSCVSTCCFTIVSNQTIVMERKLTVAATRDIYPTKSSHN